MLLRVLCVFILMLAGCDEEPRPRPTVSEYLLVQKALEHNACSIEPELHPGVFVCSFFIVFDNEVILRLREVRHGIPYVEPDYFGGPTERFSDWLVAHDPNAELRIRRYLGPSEDQFQEIWYRFDHQDI